MSGTCADARRRSFPGSRLQLVTGRWLWTQVEDMGPGPRQGPSMSWDPVASHVLLFGGIVPGSSDPAAPTPMPARPLNDTWNWDGDRWFQVQDSGPPGRGQASLAPAPGVGALMFGGQYGARLFNDTWIWDGANWTQVDDDGPGAVDSVMAFDPGENATFLVGSGTTSTRPTWIWDGAHWTQIHDMTPALETRLLAWDAPSQEMVLCGRQSGSGRFLTFAWAQMMWVPLSDMGPREPVLAVFSSSHGVVARTAAETWLWDRKVKRWTQVQNMGGRFEQQPAAAWDVEHGFGVLFDGLEGKTWRLTPPPA